AGGATLLVHLPPGERHELVSVARDRLRDGVRTVEQAEVAVRELDLRRALAHDRAEDVARAVDVQIALDVDQALVVEVAVDRQVAVAVEHAFAGAAVEGPTTRAVLDHAVVVAVDDADGGHRRARDARARPREEVRLADLQHLPWSGVEPGVRVRRRDGRAALVARAAPEDLACAPGTRQV